MKKHIVYYYSRTGNNEFIAKKIADELNCKYEAIIPKANSFLSLIFMTLLNIPAGIRTLKNNPGDYEKVIVCSPIWIGNLVAPIRGFFKKFREDVAEFVFITVCGSGEEENKTKYGYDAVHQKAQKTAKGKISLSKALSLKLIEKENEIPEEEAMHGIKIKEDFFSGEFKEAYKKLIKDIKI
jgi:flavodoxin